MREGRGVGASGHTRHWQVCIRCIILLMILVILTSSALLLADNTLHETTIHSPTCKLQFEMKLRTCLCIQLVKLGMKIIVSSKKEYVTDFDVTRTTKRLHALVQQSIGQSEASLATGRVKRQTLLQFFS